MAERWASSCGLHHPCPQTDLDSALSLPTAQPTPLAPLPFSDLSGPPSNHSPHIRESSLTLNRLDGFSLPLESSCNSLTWPRGLRILAWALLHLVSICSLAQYIPTLLACSVLLGLAKQLPASRPWDLLLFSFWKTLPSLFAWLTPVLHS